MSLHDRNDLFGPKLGLTMPLCGLHFIFFFLVKMDPKRTFSLFGFDPDAAFERPWTFLTYQFLHQTKNWTAEERQKLRDDVPKLGFKAMIRGKSLLQLASQTLALAEQGLVRRKKLDQNGRDETRYLRPLQEIVAGGITPAEELLEKYHGPWHGSVEPIYDEYAY